MVESLIRTGFENFTFLRLSALDAKKNMDGVIFFVKVINQIL